MNVRLTLVCVLGWQSAVKEQYVNVKKSIYCIDEV